MFDDFEQYLREQQQYLKFNMPELTDEQIDQIRSVAVERKMRRKDCLVQQGEICQYKIFVIRGLLRTYSTAEDGSEHVMRFTAEHEWTTDPESYTNQTPSNYTIEALEATDVIVWNRDDFDRLRMTIPAVNALSESAMALTIRENQKRVLMNISATAEGKYQYFMTSFPDIFRRVPLHMIASYLGVSRETLTRIRHGLVVAAKE